MKFLNEPFIEVLISIDIIIGNLWLVDYITTSDCRIRQLYWLDRKPKSVSLIKDIAINLKKQVKMDLDYQYNFDHRYVLMD